MRKAKPELPNNLPSITAKTCRLFDKTAKELPPAKLKELPIPETKIRIEKLVISLPSYESLSGRGFTVALTDAAKAIETPKPKSRSGMGMRKQTYDLRLVRTHTMEYHHDVRE
jgi:hypothetical protein